MYSASKYIHVVIDNAHYQTTIIVHSHNALEQQDETPTRDAEEARWVRWDRRLQTSHPPTRSKRYVIQHSILQKQQPQKHTNTDVKENAQGENAEGDSEDRSDREEHDAGEYGYTDVTSLGFVWFQQSRSHDIGGCGGRNEEQKRESS